MKKTIFHIAKMDCPTEERLVRMRLQGMHTIKGLVFDLVKRNLVVHHDDTPDSVEKVLAELHLGVSYVSHEDESEDTVTLDIENNTEKKILVVALIINFSFFGGELLAGFLSHSMGLLADSLDMLADAIVYGLSLVAVGGALTKKRQVAKLSGYFQLLLALLGLVEVLRRFFLSEAMPEYRSMILVSLLALVGNALTLYILRKNKSQDAHMMASRIFTSNDVLVNILVIASGILVHLLHSRVPDLIVGGFIFLIVANGSRKILALSRS